MPREIAAIVDQCLDLYQDLNFSAARRWRDEAPGRHVIGLMPVYTPRELIHAAGMLPLGVFGGGDGIEVIRGDAYYQSYICRIPRSTIELALTGRLDFVDGMLFPSTCDVIRNLSGMWKLMFPDKYARYFDTPQNFRDDVGGAYYVRELLELKAGLEKISGRQITNEALAESIVLYNENRALIREMYDFRADRPWRAPAWETYLLLRAGMVLPVEAHSALIKEYLEAAEAEERPMRDNCRVVINGSFCEQPPLNLIKSIELAGCHIVDDDYMVGSRWLTEDVSVDGDPLQALADAFLRHSTDCAVKYEADGEEKGRWLARQVRERKAEGVIFAAPSFCDPALLDRPMLTAVLAEENIPYISFKYAENSGQMQPIREQAGAFADSIKLWSD